eukprot:2381447-Pyramimonas_sp.AAC.1
MRWMLEGFSLGADFNAVLGVFAPKGEEDDDGNGAIRSAANTRPLGLKSADNKFITAACCYCLLYTSDAADDTPCVDL